MYIIIKITVIMMMMTICRALYQDLGRRGDHRCSHLRLTRRSYIINDFAIIIIMVINIVIIIIITVINIVIITIIISQISLIIIITVI